MAKETYSYRNYLNRAKYEMSKLARDEEENISKKDFPWKVYNSSLDKGDFNYESTFAALLKERSFSKFLRERKRQTGTAFGLDIMGTTDFPHVDGQMGMTLSDTRTKAEKVLDTKRNKYIIAGNIIENKPWNIASEFIQHDPRKQKGFDLTVCRPILGWTRLFDKRRIIIPNEIYETTERTIIQRAVNLANPMGGEVFIKFRGSDELDYHRWLENLGNMPQLKIRGKVHDITLDVLLNISRRGETEKVKLPQIPRK